MNHLLDWHAVQDRVWESALQATDAYARERGLNAARHTGRSLALVFFNNSLRTRVSMELAALETGARPVVVSPGSGTWGFAWNDGEPMAGREAEHIRDAVAVLSRYADAIGVRLFASGTDREADSTDRLLHRFSEASSVPVINLESASRHPCQALADAAVLRRYFMGRTKGKRFLLTWAPHPKALPAAVPNSALLMAARLGMDITVARPDGFQLDDSVMDQAHRTATIFGGTVSETSDQTTAAADAEIVYAKAWGGDARYENPDAEAATRTARADWRITSALMRMTNNAQFMHCLPVRRGVVVDDDVLDGANTLHLEQAEYRLHAQKAILDYCWGCL